VRGTRGLIAIVAATVLCAGCGQTASGGGGGGAGSPAAGGRSATSGALPTAHPQAVEPVAGDAPAESIPASAGVSVDPPGSKTSLPQPQSNAQIRQALARSGMTAGTDQATLTANGLAVAPLNAPAAVQEVIAAGNQIARLPYRYGGGHMTYEDTAYDCSGSISYVFAAAHLLDQTVVSGQLMNWGDPGPGKWITVFANAGHTFMYVAGLRFDTVALAQTGSRWSDTPADEPDLSTFAVRHPPGL
jgi:cell wall-associated NlpC family hydrolase